MPATGMRMAARRTNRGLRSWSVAFEVGVELPAGDLLLIALPLHLLRLDETFEEVDTQRIPHDLVLAQIAQGLREGPGELAELVAGERLRVEGIEILLDGRRQGQLLTDPPETGVQHGGKGEVGIARGIGGAEFDPDGAAVTAAGTWHSNQGRAVHLRPGDRHWCFEAGHEALVGVDQGRDQRT